jgi:hypothetical protein
MGRHFLQHSPHGVCQFLHGREFSLGGVGSELDNREWCSSPSPTWNRTIGET